MRAHNFIDLTGRKFGRLIVTKLNHVYHKKTFWQCECLCGNKTVVYSSKLKSGHTKSCGCLHLISVIKHGESRTLFYRRWHSIKERCGKHRNYKKIKICKRWNNYLNFKKDMYPSFVRHYNKHGIKNTTIDRINNLGDYKPSNCRWATVRQQNNNFSRNVFYKYNGIKRTISEWHRLLTPSISVHCFYNRLMNLGWSMDKTLATPTNKYNNAKT